MTNTSEYSTPIISVLLFGALRDVQQRDSVAIAIPSEAATTLTAARLLELCETQHPQLARWLPHLRVAVNCEYVTSESAVSVEDEVAFIPPVAGG